MNNFIRCSIARFVRAHCSQVSIEWAAFNMPLCSTFILMNVSAIGNSAFASERKLTTLFFWHISCGRDDGMIVHSAHVKDKTSWKNEPFFPIRFFVSCSVTKHVHHLATTTTTTPFFGRCRLGIRHFRLRQFHFLTSTIETETEPVIRIRTRLCMFHKQYSLSHPTERYRVVGAGTK